MAAHTDAQAPEEIYFTARDGLRIHARRYPASPAMRYGIRPVVCLPGLTRNGRDFHDIAFALSTDNFTPRNVYTIDYRGRGLSEFDPRLAQLRRADRDARRHRLHDAHGPP